MTFFELPFSINLHFAISNFQFRLVRDRVRPEAFSSRVGPAQEVQPQFITPKRASETHERKQGAAGAEDPVGHLFFYERGEGKKVDDPHADQHEDNAREGAVGKEHLPVIFLYEIYFRRDHEQTIIEPIPDVNCRSQGNVLRIRA